MKDLCSLPHHRIYSVLGRTAFRYGWRILRSAEGCGRRGGSTQTGVFSRFSDWEMRVFRKIESAEMEGPAAAV